jgi:NADPH:quinone reductase-like Zn-dependent oxidoreductase
MLLTFKWPRVYGFDFSGEVVAVGPREQKESKESEQYDVGDNVFGMIRGLPQANTGTVQEYVLVDEDVCARCPSNVSHADCASVPLVGITAIKQFRACGLKPRPRAPGEGPRVLVTGGAGGMGTLAIQLAKNLYGAQWVATTSTKGPKADLCTRLGADEVIDYRTQDFARVLSQPGKELFDAILDCTGEAAKCVPLLKPGGGLVSILAGATAECLRTWMVEARLRPADCTTGVQPFLQSNWGGNIFQWFSGGSSLSSACAKRGGTFAHVIGTGNGEIMRLLAPLMSQGLLVATIDKRFPLSESIQAIVYQKSGRAAGKVVIDIIPS